ncbi:hypothetical protein DL770_001670 [Monosporascus sp. CRB-9-2]|nr:hypothetical protein DL770_001670 [Monosporascus sp. CRB-9-2]
MTNDHIHDSTTSNVLSWSSQSAHMQHAPDEETSAEVDEPPDDISFSKQTMNQFKRNAVRKPTEQSESLLTKALHNSEDDAAPDFHLSSDTSRRRSLNSNISLTSTADLTPDTGFTSPARTNTPSPPPPMFSLPYLNAGVDGKTPSRPTVNDHGDVTHARDATGKPGTENATKDSVVEVLAKKRCISFACGPKTAVKKPPVQPQSPHKSIARPTTEEQKPERRTCIKFACPSKPSAQGPSIDITETTPTMPRAMPSSTREKGESPIPLRKYRSPSISRSRARRSSTPRPVPHSSSNNQNKKYLTANPGDLNSESSRFHEFASDEPQEEDWIRLNLPAPGHRLTINDTLQKENEIRRLGKEAEDEALDELEQEEQDDGEDDEVGIPDDEGEDENEEDDEDGEEDEDEDEDESGDGNGDDEDNDGYDVDDDQSIYDSTHDVLDGYNTDSEIGFADSDDDENDGGDLELWTLSQGRLSEGTPICRRPSFRSAKSDSSTCSEMATATTRKTRGRSQRLKIRPGTPELPDSTDFVCGTLDEDRVLEDAYISCIAARRRERLHIIPQDIDPSFPTSEPEDEDGEPHNPGNNSDDHVWIHGELEDLHHDKAHGGERRRKKSEHVSPKRYRSPPPKRILSPAPKGRARSPRRLHDRHSPRRAISPAPARRLTRSQAAAPVVPENQGRQEFGPLALGAVTQTKSLPRAPGIIPQHLKGPRRGKQASSATHGHVRGAIDIVKGLEQKRQRRKEKFKEKYFHKHCDRARKGQTQDKRPQPGQGAERMREIGLITMASKRGQGQFVLSV